MKYIGLWNDQLRLSFLALPPCTPFFLTFIDGRSSFSQSLWTRLFSRCPETQISDNSWMETDVNLIFLLPSLAITSWQYLKFLQLLGTTAFIGWKPLLHGPEFGVSNTSELNLLQKFNALKIANNLELQRFNTWQHYVCSNLW